MRRAGVAVALAAAVAVAAAVGVSAGTAGPRRHAAGSVSVLYAGSLVNVMEQKIGPAFEQATGYGYQGYGAGSTEIANEVKGGLRRGDVFISAAPAVNRSLMGEANGDRVRWYDEFASAPLVIGYNPSSRFAADFRTKPWWRVLQQPGLRLGRTDPALDPKGQLAIEFAKRVQAALRIPGFFRKTLGSAENASQLFPEEALLGRLETGQLDAGFFYSIEAKEAKLPTVAPPLGARYAARYTVTILNGAPDPQAALAFVRFLLGRQGAALLGRDGFHLLSGEVGGDPRAVPAGLAPLVGGR